MGQLTKDLYERIKQEAKTHSITYIRIHHELEGLKLSNNTIQQIAGSKDYAEYSEQQAEQHVHNLLQTK